jgi:hypothetical protein
MEPLRAFHNKKSVKAKYLKRVRAHKKADSIVQGYGYWQDGKGCAVGCTIEGSDHSRYETELGIPEWLAYVEDKLFEGMSQKKARVWPAKFLSAIPVGADLEPVKNKFTVLLLEHALGSLDKVKYDDTKFPDVKAAIAGSKSAVLEMIRCKREGLDESAAWSAAWSAAESAAWSAASAASAARSAAESAAWSAARSAARSAAWSAARSAAESAASAARSAAWSAAESAASAARSAAWSAASAASAARSAAESAAYDYYSEELLVFLRKAK